MSYMQQETKYSCCLLQLFWSQRQMLCSIFLPIFIDVSVDMVIANMNRRAFLSVRLFYICPSFGLLQYYHIDSSNISCFGVLLFVFCVCFTLKIILLVSFISSSRMFPNPMRIAILYFVTHCVMTLCFQFLNILAFVDEVIVHHLYSFVWCFIYGTSYHYYTSY